MSNRIDFFQSELTCPALPAASVSIFVDGKLCSALEPIEIVRDGWPEFSRARLVYNIAAFVNSDLMLPEDIETVFAMGKTLRICSVYNAAASGTVVFSYPLFDGQIESIETKLHCDRQTVELVARDFSVNLERVTVFGQRISNSNGTDVFLKGFDTVFNPDSKPNASESPVNLHGKNYRAFCPEGSRGELWTYAKVIDYLLNEYVPAGRLQTPGLSRLQALTDNQIARDLDVTGLNLLEALHRCCGRIGLNFKFVPTVEPSGPSQAIVFYRNDTGRTVELDYQKTDQQLSISKTNIAALDSKRNFWPVTHKHIGLGDFRIFEATFDLTMGWDSNLESSYFDYFSPSTNSDFYRVRDVYRKWVLNEAGDYSGPPYYRGEAFDFSKIFQDNEFVYRRRRFWPTLTTDKQNRSLGYYLQVSYDDGLSWWQYLDAFNTLMDECGVWLSSERLGTDMWEALLKGCLRFRITASVISDSRLSASVVNGPVDSVVPVVEHVFTLPRQFKYCKVSDRSIFANSTDPMLGIPNEVDDSNALYEFVRHAAAASSDVIETIDIQTLSLIYDYRVGDKVSSGTQSRDLLGCHRDNRSTGRIVKVRMDFRNQCTYLKIVRRRKS
jgi:hypothetical protein